MKIAIAYDWLNQKSGGGEDTLKTILDLYPEADLFCLVYNKSKFARVVGRRKVITSRLQRFPNYIKKRPFLFLPFIQKSVDKLDFTGYDLVISVSSAWVKNIKTPKTCQHICYCFSPARMIWDSWPAYLDQQKLGAFKLGPVLRFIITKQVSKLRLWDYYSTSGVDEFISISHYIQKRIKKYYRRSSIVVYPPVNLPKDVQLLPKQNYYIVISVLSRYKNIELAINTFAKNQQKLVIVGDGPDKQRLQNLAKNYNNIKFLGYVDDAKKYKLLAQAKAFIFCSVEDFGIAPIEALAVTTPVIAPNAGGLAETIEDGKLGVLYDKLKVDSLKKAIELLSKKSFSTKVLQLAANQYSSQAFTKNFKSTVKKLTKSL